MKILGPYLEKMERIFKLWSEESRVKRCKLGVFENSTVEINRQVFEISNLRKDKKVMCI